jgi:hypothetical protein
MIGAPLLVLVSTLGQAPAASPYTPAPLAQASSTVRELPPEDGGVHFHAALEALAGVFPSGTPEGALDGFLIARPRLGVTGGEEFEFELGAPLRLRLLDQEPLQSEQDFGKLRRQDWDEPSDYAQVLRSLRIGTDEGPFILRAGAFSSWSVGTGHLVSRYDNRLSPDYHPAGASLAARFGPARVDFFASDVLAARLFAAEVGLDIGRLTGLKEDGHDRYFLSVGAAYDFGQAGGVAPPLSAVKLGVQAGLLRSDTFQLWVQAAGGARGDMLDEPMPDVGAALGVVMLGRPEETVEIQGKLEARRQGGAFRFGLFGPDYELARFSGVGLAEVPRADERLPTDFAGYAEVKATLGSGVPEELELVGSAAGEYFLSGRLDVDLVLEAHLPGGLTELQLRAIGTSVMDRARYSLAGEVRHRFLPAVYVIAAGGTVHIPQADGSLMSGFHAGLGLGVDFQR